MSDAKYCPKCRTTSTTESDKFCYKCGDKLSIMPQCKKCKNTIWDYEDFCPKCGTEK
jgi:RNA polymerase subunit RPABC4/transcription elongation factor Spt4